MAAPANSDFDALITTTFRKVRALMADNLSTESVVLASIKKAGGVREEAGGHSIQENLLYGSNSTFQSYAGYEPLDVTPQDGISAAEFQWKQLAATISISGIEEFKNSGKSRIVSLLETKLKQAKITFSEGVDEQMLLDGTGNGGKNLTGLDLLVEDGTAWSVVGGIDSNTHTWWRNQFIDFDGTYDTNFAKIVSGQQSCEGLRAMRRMYNLCKRGKDKPNLILTSDVLTEAYEAYAEGHHGRINMSPNSQMLELGFENITFKGVPIVWSDDVAEDDMWFLNTNHIKFVIGKGKNFSVSEFVQPEDQDARVARMILYANFSLSNRARQGRIIDFAD